MPKKKIFFITVITAVLTLGMSVSLQTLLAAWTNPTGIPPANNVNMPIFNVANDILYPVINGYLTINDNFAVGINTLVAKRSTGKVGIGTTSPASTLEVGGDVKMGNSGIVCSASTYGAVHYNSVNHAMDYCNGTTWQELAIVDNTPSAYNFTDLTSQALNALVVSNTITPTNFQKSLVTVAGAGNPQIRCNGGAWSNSCLLYESQTLQARLTTANTYSVSNVATIVQGTVSTQWSVTTGLPSKLNCKAWYDAGYTTDGIYSIDPDGAGAIVQQTVYCKMSGQWALVVGAAANDKKHINSGEVTPTNLTSLDGKGKYSDVFINALKLTGRNEMALEAIPTWSFCKDATVAEGFANCNQAHFYSGCDFHADVPIGTNYTTCMAGGGPAITTWKNYYTGSAYIILYGSKAATYGMYIDTNGSYTYPGGFWEMLPSNISYPGRLWAR